MSFENIKGVALGKSADTAPKRYRSAEHTVEVVANKPKAGYKYPTSSEKMEVSAGHC